jgi:hypothetical protein
MKALSIAIFATFVFALIIIYHDAQRTKAELGENVKIIVCNGKIVQISK